MPRITKKERKICAFLDELNSKDIIKNLPDMKDWSYNQEQRLEWSDEDGFEWNLRCTKTTESEYSITCSNWKTIIRKNITKTEKRKQTIHKSCYIYLLEEYGTSGKDIYYRGGDYVYVYVQA